MTEITSGDMPRITTTINNKIFAEKQTLSLKVGRFQYTQYISESNTI